MIDHNLAGSGALAARELEVGRAAIAIAGSGGGEFASAGKVEARIACSGEMTVRGRADCSIKAMGSGQVRCRTADSTAAAPASRAAPAAPPAPSRRRRPNNSSLANRAGAKPRGERGFRMRGFPCVLLASASMLLSGCVAKTLVDVATLPVRAGAKAVDLATTSQSEADQNRGREIRRREEQLGKLERAYARQRKKCDEGSEEACAQARATYAQMQEILPTIPAEPARPN